MCNFWGHIPPHNTNANNNIFEKFYFVNSCVFSHLAQVCPHHLKWSKHWVILCKLWLCPSSACSIYLFSLLTCQCYYYRNLRLFEILRFIYLNIIKISKKPSHTFRDIPQVKYELCESMVRKKRPKITDGSRCEWALVNTYLTPLPKMWKLQQAIYSTFTLFLCFYR